MRDGFFAYGFVGMAQRPQFVFPILKQIGVNRAQLHALGLGEIGDAFPVGSFGRQVPRDMQGHTRRRAAKPVDGRRILNFLVNVNGAPVRSLFRADIEVAHSEGDKIAVLKVRQAAVFSNWLSLKGHIIRYVEGRDEVVLDLSATTLVDHSTMEKLHQLEQEFAEAGKRLTVTGLENHRAMSAHPLAARKGAGVAAPKEMSSTPAA